MKKVNLNPSSKNQIDKALALDKTWNEYEAANVAWQ